MLVVDRRAARARGQPGGARAAGRPGPEPAGAVHAARRARPGPRCSRPSSGRWPKARGPRPGATCLLAFGAGPHAHAARARALHAPARQRMRPAPRPRTAQRALRVLLLEDVRTLQARIRQEKLAAMGRVSAGIAHEIRNPLAAIAQANALLLEDATAAGAAAAGAHGGRQRRAPEAPGRRRDGGGARHRARAARHRRHGRRWPPAAADWARTVQLPPGRDSRLRAGPAGGAAAACCSTPNTCAACSSTCSTTRTAMPAPTPGCDLPAPGGARRGHGRARRCRATAPPIAPEVERHLFEPFFSTRSRGSGLGLYICRELCERYGASIEYRPRPAAERLRNEFSVAMRRAAMAAADARTAPPGHLNTPRLPP